MTNKENLTKYLNSIYQNAKIGLQSIEDILPKIEKTNLKDEIARQQNGYFVIVQECEVFAKSESIENIKDNNWIEKAKMWTSINMSTLMDKSNRKIAEMMILGTFMGILSCTKELYDNQGISNELDSILIRLKEFQKNNLEQLIPFLTTAQ